MKTYIKFAYSAYFGNDRSGFRNGQWSKWRLCSAEKRVMINIHTTYSKISKKMTEQNRWDMFLFEFAISRLSPEVCFYLILNLISKS